MWRRNSRGDSGWVAAISLLFTYAFWLEYLPPWQRVHLPFDIHGYHYPLLQYAFQAFSSGRLPEWDPSVYCGLSFVGNMCLDATSLMGIGASSSKGELAFAVEGNGRVRALFSAGVSPHVGGFLHVPGGLCCCPPGWAALAGVLAIGCSLLVVMVQLLPAWEAAALKTFDPKYGSGVQELRTTLTELAKNGAYYKEFITQSDWFHSGEGMRAFFFLGLSDPNNEIYRERTKRFAGMYMNEDPEAPNYDPVHKIIRMPQPGSENRSRSEYWWS